MKVFVDTSAWIALADKADPQHSVAHNLWSHLMEASAELVTTNYVMVETIAVLQRRLGMEAVRAFLTSVAHLDIGWVDDLLHQAGIQQFVAANRRSLSLVDCVSFEFMRRSNIRIAFCFDTHFSEAGFEMLAESHFETT